MLTALERLLRRQASSDDGEHRHGADAARPARRAMQIALAYGALAFVWIVSSDAALRVFAADPESLSALQTTKGWAFVAVTGFLLFLVLRREFSRQQAAADDLRRARDRAIESSRLKSAFLANISHEIRTPLNVILGYTSLIAEQSMDLGDENPRQIATVMDRSARRLLRTIHQVLDYSKIQSGQFDLHPTEVRLAGAIDPIVEEYRTLAEEKGLGFTWENDAADTLVRIDPACLTGAVANLIDNAIKFTERGSVAVRLYEADGGAPRLEVRDTGVGITKEYLERCFEPFSQEDDSYTRRFEGTGIGLPLTKCYLELNGASLSVESEKGRGSVLRICFPRTVSGT